MEIKKEDVLEYLSKRRDYYKREKEAEDRKLNPNPALQIRYGAREEAFKEAIYHVSLIL